MDDRRSQSRHAITTEGLNFGIDRILKNDTESGKYIVLIISRRYIDIDIFVVFWNFFWLDRKMAK